MTLFVLLKFNIGFNPRTHEGCDLRQSSTLTTKLCFNPRTHEGCDICDHSFEGIGVGFNPRTHEGCDYLTFSQLKKITCFNPRTHEGCDCRLDEENYCYIVSIHAPTRGAT